MSKIVVFHFINKMKSAQTDANTARCL